LVSIVSENRGLVASVGPVQVDVPRTAGYYGGIGAALALGIIDWPVAVFIGGIPLVKLLKGRPLRWGLNVAVQFFEGAAKPVGGDAEGTIQLDGAAEQLEAGEPSAPQPPPPARRRSRPRPQVTT
jgi:hypothetical protein